MRILLLYLSFTVYFFVCMFTMLYLFFFFLKEKTAYEMRIGDWSSDVCSSDLLDRAHGFGGLRPVDRRLDGIGSIAGIPQRIAQQGPAKAIFRPALADRLADVNAVVALGDRQCLAAHAAGCPERTGRTDHHHALTATDTAHAQKIGRAHV